MVYDMNQHLPQIIEEMRQDMRTRNINGLNANKMFLEKTFKELETIIKSAEKIRTEKHKNVCKKYSNELNTITHTDYKEQDDMITESAIAYNKQLEQLDQNEWDFWETIISKTIEYNKNKYTEYLEQQRDNE